MVCDKCKRLCKHAKTNCMLGHGNKNARIMFVGEAPGEDEDREGRPFIGKAGGYLRRHLFLSSGIDSESVFITNAVRCRPPKNKKPTVREMRNCRSYLFDEIEVIKPKVIVPLGNVPLYSVLYLDGVRDEEKDDKESGMSGITKWRGKKLWHREFNCWVVPALHPSGLMRKRQFGEVYPTDQTVADFELALKLSEQRRPRMSYPKTVWITEKQEAINVIKHVYSFPEFAVDTEAENFEWWQAPLYGISLAVNGELGYYLDFQALDINDVQLKRALIKLLGNRALKVMHNSTFDVKMLHSQGITVRGVWFDTMQAAHLIDENFYKGLKPLTWRYLNFGGYDHALDAYRRDNKLTKSFKGIPGEVLAPYAGCDAVATFLLYKHLKPLLDAQELSILKRSILMPARKVFTNTEINGIRIDRKKTEMLGGLMQRLEDGLLNKIWAVAGCEFNLKSPKQKQELFFGKFGMCPLKETKSSTHEKPSYSTDGDSLEYLVAQGGSGGKVAALLTDYTYLTKQHSTFVNAILKNARVHADGNYYMHTNYNMTGTVTLRISCYNPCTHNIPNDGLIKGLYIPRPGRRFCYADVKAAEMRVLAVYTKEPQLLNAFIEGRDVHTEVWRLMFDKGPRDVPTQEERRDTKRIVFGLIYGMGIKALAKRIGKSIDVAADYVERFFDRLPHARMFFERTYDELACNGYVTTLFNSRRRLPAVYGDDGDAVGRAQRQAVNTKIQTVAAVFTYVGLNRVARRISAQNLGAMIVHSIHDCVIVDVPYNEELIIAGIIKESFERRVKVLPIKMAVDVEHLDNWGQDCDESRIAKIVESVGIRVTPEERELFGAWIK